MREGGRRGELAARVVRDDAEMRVRGGVCGVEVRARGDAAGEMSRRARRVRESRAVRRARDGSRARVDDDADDADVIIVTMCGGYLFLFLKKTKLMYVCKARDAARCDAMHRNARAINGEYRPTYVPGRCTA